MNTFWIHYSPQISRCCCLNVVRDDIRQLQLPQNIYYKKKNRLQQPAAAGVVAITACVRRNGEINGWIAVLAKRSAEVVIEAAGVCPGKACWNLQQNSFVMSIDRQRAIFMLCMGRREISRLLESRRSGRPRAFVTSYYYYSSKRLPVARRYLQVEAI